MGRVGQLVSLRSLSPAETGPGGQEWAPSCAPADQKVKLEAMLVGSEGAVLALGKASERRQLD